MLDVHLPGLSGLDLQQELAKAGVKIPIIFITGHGDIPTSVRAIKAGALEFLTKPLNREDLLRAIQQAIARDDIARQPNGATGTHNFDEIIGESPALKRTLKQVEIVAPTDSDSSAFRRNGNGQGADCPRDPQSEFPPRTDFGESKLRGHTDRPA